LSGVRCRVCVGCRVDQWAAQQHPASFPTGLAAFGLRVGGYFYLRARTRF